MGIYGLHRYILDRESIAQYCDYKEEIAKWRLEHSGCNPTILIELTEIANSIVRIFYKTIKTGGIFDKYNEAITYFFNELKKCGVDLVFFLKEKSLADSESGRQKVHKRSILGNSTDQISRGNRRWVINVIMIAEKYGELILSDKGNNGVLAKYAFDHEDKVLAVIGNDTDFLLYESKYQYWPIANWYQQEFRPNCTRYPGINGLRFDRDALLTEIQLNSEQLHLLVTMSDTFETWYNFPKCPPNATFVESMECAIKYVRDQSLTHENTYDWEMIARDLYGENYTGEQAAVFKKRYTKFAIHKTSKIADKNVSNEDGSIDTLQYCKTRLFAIFNTFLACSKTFFFLNDICRLSRTFPQNIELADSVYSAVVKIAGIFYKDGMVDQRPSILRIYNPLLCGNGGGIEDRDIAYPPDSHVTLKELIMKRDSNAYDNERWELLGWVLSLNGGFLSTVREIPGTKKIRVVTISLNFLLERNLISTRSAKCILQNELIARSSNAYTPKHHCPPPIIHIPQTRYINLEWIEEANRYCIVYWLVCQALGACGLQKEMDLIEFNAFKFFEAMTMPNSSGQNSQIEQILFPMNAAQ